MNPLNPDGTVALTLSSGPYYTLHSDFWNTWQQERLDQLVQDCLAAGVHCGSVDETRSVDWTSQFGTQRYDLAYATAAADDGVYVAGFTNYALPGQPYHHGYDAFVRMYDAAGTKLWTRQFGTPGTDQVLAAAVDDSGVYVVGSTDGRFPKQASGGGLDAFVAKFAPSGRPMWLSQFGTRGADEATAVAVAGTGLFVAGSTDGRLARTRVGGTDAFVGGFSLEGEPRWIRQFGSTSRDEAHGMALGPGRVWVVGSTNGALPGRPRSGASTRSSARTTSAASRVGPGIRLDGADDATSVSVTPGASVRRRIHRRSASGQTSSGGTDAFLTRLTGRGEPGLDAAVRYARIGRWHRRQRQGRGRLRGRLDDGRVPDQELLGETDGFVRRYEPKGIELWTLQFGTPDFDQVYGLAVGPRAAYVTGTTHGAFEGHLNAGDRDVFLTRVALE